MIGKNELLEMKGKSIKRAHIHSLFFLGFVKAIDGIMKVKEAKKSNLLLKTAGMGYVAHMGRAKIRHLTDRSLLADRENNSTLL
jgi:hypothetical protein